MSLYKLCTCFAACVILVSSLQAQEAETGPATNPPISDQRGKLPEASAEEQQEFEKAFTEFFRVRQQLGAALAEQEDVYIRYVNREDRTPAARKKYFENRQQVRQLMDQTYRAALDVTKTGVLNEQLVRFIVTMVQHRIKTDYYDADTFEGAAKMLDADQNMQFLFSAAARSAIVVGEFDSAERLYQPLIQAEDVPEIDAIMYSNLDSYREQWNEEQRIREQDEKEDRLPRVKLETTQGDVVLELFLDQAPNTVANFVQLVESGFYDGLDFYQVIDHILALTGDPMNNGSGNSGKYIQDEHDRKDSRHAFRGSLLMAKLPTENSGEFVPNSASSQFAILLLPIASASEQQTVFGRVIEGMDVVSRLRRVDPNKEKQKGEILLPADSIIEATVIRRPENMPEPEYINP